MEKWAAALADLCGERLVGGRVLTISTSQQRRYFKPAAQLAKQGVRARRLLKEEADDLAAELLASFDKPLETPTMGWFVRSSACSPKDACHDGGAGPHQSLVDVLLALLASDRIHTSMRDYETDITVYLMPFDTTVNTDRELRVFVHERQVTAMSQYDCLNPSCVFGKMDTEELAAVACCVDSFHRELVSPRWEAAGGIASYVMDVEYIMGEGADNEPQVRLIELNSFGAEYAAASALFHWVRDASELHSSSRLCIRVLGEQ